MESTRFANDNDINFEDLFNDNFYQPISHSVRHQRPTRERHKICIASRENVDNQTPRNTNFTHKHVSVYF